jgi:membrane fusion protein (multidrug efflux system)
VQASPQGQFVYIVTPDSKVAPQPIKTAGFSGQDWIVVDGLKGGERVVVDGLQKIRPGATVNPIMAGAAPQAPPAAAAAPASRSAGEPAPSQSSTVSNPAPADAAQKPSTSMGGKPAVAAER